MLDFESLIENTIDSIAQTIEDHDKEGELEIDLNDSILTIITNDGTFILNKQRAAQELWLSSPISGPYHFAWKDNIWISKYGDKLLNILSQELDINFLSTQKILNSES